MGNIEYRDQSTIKERAHAHAQHAHVEARHDGHCVGGVFHRIARIVDQDQILARHLMRHEEVRDVVGMGYAARVEVPAVASRNDDLAIGPPAVLADRCARARLCDRQQLAVRVIGGAQDDQ
jgi:hypothetical protein